MADAPKKRNPKTKTRRGPVRQQKDAKQKDNGQPQAKLGNSELLKTRGKEAYERIADLALKEGLEKEELLVRCLIFLADQWARNARKKLETASDFEATLADIARRAAEKYGRKCKQRGTGKGG